MILLPRMKYSTVAQHLKHVRFNHLFARSVIDGHVTGSVFVDRIDQPETFYVIHPYGMSLLFGTCFNQEFNAAFRQYALDKNHAHLGQEWMQAFPFSWDEVLLELFKDSLISSTENIDKYTTNKIVLDTRVNFKFNLQKYIEFKEDQISQDHLIVRADKAIFEAMRGIVVPSKFWDNSSDFEEHGVGFSLFHENKLAATAFSSSIHEGFLELGIETLEEFKGRGFAKHTCSALIDYSIENNYEPIWSCSLDNVPSYQLAQKLGFEPVLTIPYYRLSRNYVQP